MAPRKNKSEDLLLESKNEDFDPRASSVVES